MRSWLLVPLLSALACSHELDALYVEEDGVGARPGGVTSVDDLPVLPARPDERHRDECAACARSECPKEREDCFGDDACTAELQCKSECDDPACLQGCTAEDGWSLWYADYAVCVYGACAEECNVGNNWDCQGNYDWPAAPPREATFEVLFSFKSPPEFYRGGELSGAPIGATVRACPDQAECVEQSSGEIAFDGTTRLELTADTLPPNDYRGYLEIDDGEEAGERSLVYMNPIARPQVYYARAVVSLVGPPGTDFDRARVVAVVSDCLSMPVAGAVVTLTDPELASIPAFGWNSRMELPEGPTTGTGGALLFDVPDSATERKQRVRAERRAGDELMLISEREIWLRPGYMTRLPLGPAARSDL